MRLEDYREIFEHLWNEEASCVVSNAKPKHVTDVLEVFFRRASGHVRMFCNGLPDGMYDRPDLLQAVSLASARGVFIEVMIPEEAAEDTVLSRLLGNLRNPDGGRPLFKFSGQASASWSPSKTEFAVADDRAYRFASETNKGVACAHGRKTSSLLLEWFQAAKKSSSRRTIVDLEF